MFILFLVVYSVLFNPIIQCAGLEENNIIDAASNKDQYHFYLSQSAEDNSLKAGEEIRKSVITHGASSFGAAWQEWQQEQLQKRQQDYLHFNVPQ